MTRGRGRDQVDVEFALEPLADDLEMQEPEKAAAEAEAERGRGLHLVGEARIVEAELADRLAQILELARIDREQAAEHHRLRRLEAWQRFRRRLLLVGHGIADAGVGDLPDRGGEEADLARPERIPHLLLGAEDTDAVDLVGAAGQHQPDALAFAERAVDDAHEHDDAEIGVVPAVDEQRLQRLRRVALGRGQPVHDRFEHVRDAEPGLGRDLERVMGVEPDHVLDLLAHLFRLRRRQVDLVQDRDHLVVVVERLIDIGERLRLDALGSHRPPAASLRRPRGCGSPHRRNRHGQACRSGSARRAGRHARGSRAAPSAP